VGVVGMERHVRMEFALLLFQLMEKLALWTRIVKEGHCVNSVCWDGSNGNLCSKGDDCQSGFCTQTGILGNCSDHTDGAPCVQNSNCNSGWCNFTKWCLQKTMVEMVRGFLIQPIVQAHFAIK